MLGPPFGSGAPPRLALTAEVWGRCGKGLGSWGGAGGPVSSLWGHSAGQLSSLAGGCRCVCDYLRAGVETCGVLGLSQLQPIPYSVSRPPSVVQAHHLGDQLTIHRGCRGRLNAGHDLSEVGEGSIGAGEDLRYEVQDSHLLGTPAHHMAALEGQCEDAPGTLPAQSRQL